jgi:poly(3-hydroxybutyrate) depolymerase
MLYHAYQLQNDWLGPLQSAARWGASVLNHPLLMPMATPAHKRLAAAWEVFSRLRLTHHRPSFGIESVQVGERQVPVHEVAVNAARSARCSASCATTSATPPAATAPRC